jgi:predicted Zn-dependent protease
MTSGDTPLMDNPSDAFARIYAAPSVALIPLDTSEMVNAEACNSWTESGVHSPTVSTARLAVPGKASSEYQKACGAYKDRRLPQAEEHVRKAIAEYPNYVAAWVVLGQVLDAQHKRDEARTACSRASTVDPNYVAPYLCLAEFAATEANWNEVSKLSQRALALDPVNNVYSLYYAADASVHLLHLTEAETNALAAVQLDTWHHLPQLHLLLAQVYAAKGDVRAEVASLRQYLKLAPNSGDAPGAKNTLAQLEGRPAK